MSELRWVMVQTAPNAALGKSSHTLSTAQHCSACPGVLGARCFRASLSIAQHRLHAPACA
eukprot:12254545-Alexandrium_andersonii.AAC.1